jgi:hypothetical protein
MVLQILIWLRLFHFDKIQYPQNKQKYQLRSEKGKKKVKTKKQAQARKTHRNFAVEKGVVDR